jgi:hypothetical protein
LCPVATSRPSGEKSAKPFETLLIPCCTTSRIGSFVGADLATPGLAGTDFDGARRACPLFCADAVVN